MRLCGRLLLHLSPQRSILEQQGLQLCLGCSELCLGCSELCLGCTELGCDGSQGL